MGQNSAPNWQQGNGTRGYHGLPQFCSTGADPLGEATIDL